MFLSFFQNKTTVEVIRKVETGEVDDFGRPIVSTQEFYYSGIVGSPDVKFSLDSSDGKIHTSDLRVYLPSGTILLQDDIFVIRGKVYKLAGSPIESDKMFIGSFMVPPVVVELVHSSFVKG